MPPIERLPSLDSSLEAALTSLVETKQGLDSVYIRVVLSDGTQVEGQVLSMSSIELCLRVSGTPEDVWLADVKAIYVAHPRAARRLVLMTAAIAGGTAAAVVYSLMPWVVIDATDGLEMFGAVAVTGGLIWKLLARSTRFWTWWTRWVALYES